MSPAPAVVLTSSASAPAVLVEAFLLGCEEEGVPVVRTVGEDAAIELARNAATHSDLFVGGGIDDAGAIAVHEHRLGKRPPVVFLANAVGHEARLAGGDAARLVLGKRLRMVAQKEAPVA